MNVASRPRLATTAAAALLVVLSLLPALVPPVSAQTPPTAPPAQPTGLTGDVTHDTVSLRWDDPGITSYQILRRDPDTDAPGVFYVHVDDTGSADNSYVDRDVEPDTSYVYRIKARNAAGLSDRISYFNAYIPAAPAEESTPPSTPEPTPEPAPKERAAKAEDDPPACPDPTPTAVAVDAVPIVVTSTTADYFVLYVSHALDADTTVELPVLVKRGEADTTTLAENVEALPEERYRVEKFLIADPADVDGDWVDDITELDSLGSMNPVNAAAAIALSDGAVAVPDQEALETITFGALKFVLLGMDTDRPSVYFVNTHTHSGHRDFLTAVSIDWDQPGITPGWIVYYQNPIASDGSRGVYAYSLSPAQRFSLVDLAYSVLAASVPLLEDDLAYEVSEVRLPDYQDELVLYEQSRIHPVSIDDILFESSFIALNEAEGYGFLRVMDLDERPNPRDVVIYEALPNELPRVAGIFSTVRQTPLSHVNLRALQDGAPNAFIPGALDEPAIHALIGSYVRYEVTETGWTLRAAIRAEFDAHYAASRPSEAQTPQRDLSVTAITPLSEIGFDDWEAFGVKAANVAVLRTLGFPAGTVPDGFAIPFYFYDEFMKHNGFYTRIETMLAASDFQTDFDVQASELKKLRKAIEDGATPDWMITAIAAMNEGFAEGVNRRYRSSTNNEDLPGFNGAGLYDSKSQMPSEDEEHLAKALKEVYASLWNFRAFVQRHFHRIDHTAAAMEVLVHPSYQDELVNGVAVSFDPTRGRDGDYYVNSQVGEDLVTNLEGHSVPEEIVLHEDGNYAVLGTSNQVPPGQLLMSVTQMNQLRRHLAVIHEEFKKLYKPASGEPFAMEIEFKITSEAILAIKQARPWVFISAPASGGGDSGGRGNTGGSSGGNRSSNGGGVPRNRSPSFADGDAATCTVAGNTATGQLRTKAPPGLRDQDQLHPHRARGGPPGSQRRHGGDDHGDQRGVGRHGWAV